MKYLLPILLALASPARAELPLTVVLDGSPACRSCRLQWNAPQRQDSASRRFSQFQWQERDYLNSRFDVRIEGAGDYRPFPGYPAVRFGLGGDWYYLRPSAGMPGQFVRALYALGREFGYESCRERIEYLADYGAYWRNYQEYVSGGSYFCVERGRWVYSRPEPPDPPPRPPPAGAWLDDRSRANWVEARDPCPLIAPDPPDDLDEED